MRYGADRRSLLQLYRSLVRSRLDYRCIVYGLASNSVKGCLNAIHHTGIRIATGAFRTSFIPSLLVEADEAPLALRHQELSMRFSYKLAQDPANPAYAVVFSQQLLDLQRERRPGMQLFFSRMDAALVECSLRKNDVVRLNYTAESPWTLATPEVDLSLAALPKTRMVTSVLLSEALSRINSWEGYTTVYTDGSMSSNGVGSAFVSGGTCRSCPLPPSAFIYTLNYTQ